MRLVYENKQSLNKEEAFKQDIERAKSLSLVKLPMVYNADYAAIKPVGDYNLVVGVIELKCRKGSFGDYPSLILSKNKVDSVASRWNLAKHWFVIAVRWNDCDVTYVWNNDHDHPVIFGGRSDRRDWQDTEPLYSIDNKYFKELKYE